MLMVFLTMCTLSDAEQVEYRLPNDTSNPRVRDYVRHFYFQQNLGNSSSVCQTLSKDTGSHGDHIEHELNGTAFPGIENPLELIVYDYVRMPGSYFHSNIKVIEKGLLALLQRGKLAENVRIYIPNCHKGLGVQFSPQFLAKFRARHVSTAENPLFWATECYYEKAAESGLNFNNCTHHAKQLLTFDPLYCFVEFTLKI